LAGDPIIGSLKAVTVHGFFP